MELFTDSHGVELHKGDYVRRLPHGIAGRVLSFDDEVGRIMVEWPHITIDVREDEIERTSPPVEMLPILEVWKSGDDVPSPNITWEVLGKWQDIDCEMWTCRICSPEKPDGELDDCFAAYVRLDACQLKDIHA